MLACPRCGGSVSPTNHSCEFCHVELLVKSCPRCFARMFHGSKHCSMCGANVIAPAVANPDGNARRRPCPRCVNVELVGRLVGEFLLDECPTCTGVFVDVTALERMLDERRQVRLDDILGMAVKDLNEPLPVQPEGPVYVKCPDCEATMNRKNFARGAGVIVDICRNHGTWFDAEELPRVIAFAASGGIERAQRADAERMLEDARRTKSAAQNAPSGMLMTEVPRRNGWGLLASILGEVLGSRR